MKVVFLAMVTALLILSASPLQSVTDASGEWLAMRVCAACHGRDGDSISPLFPRLAGQPAAYLEAQLKTFRDKTRADPPAMAYMWGMASQLDDATIKDIATYYASRAARATPTGPSASLTFGKEIYERGIAASLVPACGGCHGAAAQGNATAPRLAGQHPEYLVKQLAFFKTKLRGGDPVMVAACAQMTAEQMQAVALYASSR
jgi:cytochrome c553